MERQHVSSSNLRSVGYDPVSSVLEIEFLSRSVYQYYGVPGLVVARLLGASSKGGYFHRYIKGRYPYQHAR